MPIRQWILKIVKIDGQNSLYRWSWNQRCINEFSRKVNFGISETEFKFKYNNGTMSFRNRTHESDSKLSKFVWSLKDQNKEFDIKWSILKKSSGSKSCNLCLFKKLVISNFKEKERLLNKWLDLVSKCRHESKYILMNYWLTLKFIII